MMKMWNRRASLALTFALGAAFAMARPANANSILLDFDLDFGGNAIANNTSPNVAYPAGSYPVNTPTVAWSSNAAILLGGGGVPSQPNFLADPNFTGTIVATFSALVDSVSVQNVTNSAFVLSAYDMNGNLLGTSSADSNVNPQYHTALVNFAGMIQYVQISTQSQYGVDNFGYSWTPSNGNGQVPEPGTVALLVGAGVTGLLARRRRK